MYRDCELFHTKIRCKVYGSVMQHNTAALTITARGATSDVRINLTSKVNPRSVKSKHIYHARRPITWVFR